MPEDEIKNKKIVEKLKEFGSRVNEKALDAGGLDVEFGKFGQEERLYVDSLPKRMEKICRIVGATWAFAEKSDSENGDENGSASSNIQAPQAGGQSQASAEGGRDQDRGSPGQPATNQDIQTEQLVGWNQDNQELWNQKITSFRGENNIPGTYEILLLEEDLRVLETMLGIIKQVNEGADANDLGGRIKQIDHILLGREAYLDQSKVVLRERQILPSNKWRIGQPANRNAGPAEKGGQLKRARPGQRNQPQNNNIQGGTAGGFDFQTMRVPHHGRYISPNLNPIPGPDVVKGVLATETHRLCFVDGCQEPSGSDRRRDE